MAVRADLAATLIDIEAFLRTMGRWDAEPPSAEALASEQPFCIDTLSLPQWLQFIFLPKMHALLEAGEALPDRCGIAPLAEEFFRDNPQEWRGLIVALRRVDHLLSE